MSEHYTDGRRWSHISNAWIFEDNWNDQEEIARLRAKVASLVEERDNALDQVEAAVVDYNDARQQLAAANGRVEMLKAGLVKIADVYEYTNQIPEDMTIAEWMAEQAGAALSNLNEDGENRG
jgi:hypothetical protein